MSAASSILPWCAPQPHCLAESSLLRPTFEPEASRPQACCRSALNLRVEGGQIGRILRNRLNRSQAFASDLPALDAHIPSTQITCDLSASVRRPMKSMKNIEPNPQT